MSREQRWSKYKPRPRPPKPCIGCGHVHSGRWLWCGHVDRTSPQWRRRLCVCYYDRPRNKRQRRRFWAPLRSRPSAGSGPRQTIYSNLNYGQNTYVEGYLERRRKDKEEQHG
jgi:hypothetical protein